MSNETTNDRPDTLQAARGNGRPDVVGLIEAANPGVTGLDLVHAFDDAIAALVVKRDELEGQLPPVKGTDNRLPNNDNTLDWLRQVRTDLHDLMTALLMGSTFDPTPSEDWSAWARDVAYVIRDLRRVEDYCLRERGELAQV